MYSKYALAPRLCWILSCCRFIFFYILQGSCIIFASARSKILDLCNHVLSHILPNTTCVQGHSQSSLDTLTRAQNNDTEPGRQSLLHSCTRSVSARVYSLNKNFIKCMTRGKVPHNFGD